MRDASHDRQQEIHRRVLSGWGRTPSSAADVAVPANVGDAAALVEGAGKNGALARGLGRSYGDAALNGGGTIIETGAISRIRRLDPEGPTVTVEAGMSFDELLAALVPLGYFVPVTPGTRFVTVGGAIAADVHGKNHHVDGSIQRHVESFGLLLADGRTMRVDAASEPEMFAATCGGLGLTGIVTEATLRLLRIETAQMRVTRERTANLGATLERFAESDDRYHYSVAWIDCLARGKAMGRSVLMRANHARVDEVPVERRVNALSWSTGAGVPWPPLTPGGLLRRSTVALFNEAYYRRAPATEREEYEGIVPYFYPLDRVREWNRAYGPRGFVQYQFVVPYGAEDTLRDVLGRLSREGVPSMLAVLKRMGPGHGMLSFPVAGWTLALDIPARVPGLGPLLDGLDQLIADAGGRVYLAKDARLRRELLPTMYPELDRWKAVRARLDPAGRWQSDLARRLDLI